MDSFQPRHPANAPGNFYVAAESCLRCAAPRDEAPDLISEFDTSPVDNGCYFRKQPSADELVAACEAVCVSCTKAVRYAGSDPEILRLLYDKGAYGSCDISTAPTSASERSVREFVQQRSSFFRDVQVLWTYLLEVSRGRSVVACCFETRLLFGLRDDQFLGVYELADETGEVTFVEDDSAYRPQQYDFFRKARF